MEEVAKKEIITAISESEKLWADNGLTGLVLFALFALILIFIWFISRKDKNHQEFTDKILSDDREERKEHRRDMAENTDKLASAISSLSSEINKIKS